MDIKLLFTADWRLLEGETLLAQVRPEGRKGYGVVAVGGRDYEIFDREEKSWNFALSDESDSTVCTFEPFRLERGGRISGQGGSLELHGRIGRPRAWSFDLEDGGRLEALARRHEPPAQDGHESSSSRFASAEEMEVLLEGSIAPTTLTDAPMAVALGCWILLQWEAIPAGGGGTR